MPQINIRHKLSQAAYLTGSQQVLINNNATEYWMSGTDMAFGLKLNRHFSTEFHARLVHFKNFRNTTDLRLLVFHTLQYATQLGAYRLSIRNRIQQLTFLEHLNSDYRSPRWYNRFKIACRKRINYYYSFGLNTELFYPLNNSERKNIDQIRVGITGERRFSEKFELGAGYQIQQQIARSGNDRFYVLSLQMTLSL